MGAFACTAPISKSFLPRLRSEIKSRFAPKLMQALERAIAFCQSTLSYGRLQEAPPDRRPILLEPLVEEVHETLGLGPDAPIRWIGAVERGLVVEADYDQLFRILLNLARNAVQAMESQAADGRANRDPGRDPDHLLRLRWAGDQGMPGREQRLGGQDRQHGQGAGCPAIG